MEQNSKEIDAMKFEEVDLECQNILMNLGIIHSSNGIIYDSYFASAHVANIVTAMKVYAESTQKPKEDYWNGFDYALALLDEMYSKTNTHPYNISDCIKAKVNRLDKDKIRINPRLEQKPLTDAEIEALAEKEYPPHRENKWGVRSEMMDMGKAAFIKGYKAANPKPINPNIEQALINLEEYFQGKADADYEFNDIDGRYIPNEEMGLLNDVLVIKKYFGIE